MDNMIYCWHWDPLLSQCQFDNGQHEIILALGPIIVPMSVQYWTTWDNFGIGTHDCPNVSLIMDNMIYFWHWDSLLSQCQFNTGQHDIFLALGPIIVPISFRWWTTWYIFGFGIHYCPNVSSIMDNMIYFWHWDPLLSQCQFDNGQHEIILALGPIIVPMSVQYWTTWDNFGIGTNYCPNIVSMVDSMIYFWHWGSLLSQCQLNTGQHDIFLALEPIIVPMSVQ